ncbi:MAG: GNAT family N-acetyltransferase, partial [Pseudomonadota bacterium]
AILSAHRNKGIGGRVLADIITQAAEAQVTLALQVETRNPARRLYERLGFQTVGASPTHIEMQITQADAEK